MEQRLFWRCISYTERWFSLIFYDFSASHVSFQKCISHWGPGTWAFNFEDNEYGLNQSNILNVDTSHEERGLEKHTLIWGFGGVLRNYCVFSGRGPLIQRHTLRFASQEQENERSDGKGNGKGKRRKLQDRLVSVTNALVAAALDAGRAKVQPEDAWRNPWGCARRSPQAPSHVVRFLRLVVGRHGLRVWPSVPLQPPGCHSLHWHAAARVPSHVRIHTP